MRVAIYTCVVHGDKHGSVSGWLVTVHGGGFPGSGYRGEDDGYNVKTEAFPLVAFASKITTPKTILNPRLGVW